MFYVVSYEISDKDIRPLSEM